MVQKTKITYIRNILPLRPEVDSAHGQQPEVQEGGELLADQEGREKLQDEQADVSVAGGHGVGTGREGSGERQVKCVSN